MRVSTVNFDFGTHVDIYDNGTTAEDAEQEALFNDARNPAVTINVYIVHDLAHHRDEFNTSTPAGLTRRIAQPERSEIFIYDRAGQPQTLAHELGHALGLNEVDGTAHSVDPLRQYELMSRFAETGSTIIPSQSRAIHGGYGP